MKRTLTILVGIALMMLLATSAKRNKWETTDESTYVYLRGIFDSNGDVLRVSIQRPKALFQN